MFIRLTAIPQQDDVEGTARKVFVDANRIIMITSGKMRFPDPKAAENRHQVMNGLWDEVARVTVALNANVPSFTPNTEQEAKALQDWAQAKQAAQDLTTAANMVKHYADEKGYKDAIECTEVSLACGTALEQGVMLTRVWVTETPEQVADLAWPFAKGTIR